MLELSTADGRNGWYEARLAHGDSDAYLADVARGWALASAALEVALEVRYALITTTMNSLAQNVPPELVIAALDAGVWSGRRALAFVAQLQDPTARVDALAKMVPHVDGELRERAVADLVAAMAAGGEISEPQDALWALRDELPPAIVDELAPPASPLDEPTGEVVTDLEHRSEAQLEAALAQARAVRPKRDRALLLVELAAHHPEPAQTELQDEALELARTIRVDQGRTLALATVAVRLPPERREAAIDETLDLLDSGSIDANDVLVRLAPFLSDRQADAALAAARKIEEPGLRGDVLAALSEHLPRRLARSILLSRLAAARAEEYAPFRIDAFAALLPLLSPVTRERVGREALDTVQSLDSGSFRATHLATLAPHLPEALLREAIDAAQTIADRGPRSLLLLSLAHNAGTRLDPDAAADALAETGARAPTIVALAPFLSAAQLEAALELVVPARLDVGYGRADYGVDSAKAQVVGGVAPYLPRDLLPKALELVETIGYLEERSQALAALAPFLPPPLLDEALASARRMPPGGHADGKHGGWRHHKADALAALAPYLPEPAGRAALEDALETARAIDSKRGSAEQLVALVPHRPDVANEALRTLAAADVPDEALADAIVALAPYLAETNHGRAPKLARSISDAAGRARALIALAAGDATLAMAALSAAREVDDAVRRVSLLAEIAAFLVEPERRKVVDEALAIATGIEFYGFRAESAAIALAPLLEPEEREALLDQALAGALSLRGAGLAPDARKLLRLVPALAPARQVEALREALRIAFEEEEAGSGGRPSELDLSPLANVEAEPLHAALSPTLRDAVSQSRKFILQRLCDLVPAIVAIGEEPAAEATHDAVVAVTGWWP